MAYRSKETLETKTRLRVKNAADLPMPEFLEFAKEVLAPQLKEKPIGIMLKFPYSLRASLRMKQEDASPKARWTAFMNNAGTLCHVIHPEAELLLRIQFKYPIKHLNSWQMLQAVEARAGDFIKI